jgi:exodeoxyribonuclease-3
MEPPLRILTLNVCNPSRARAERQLQWLSERPEQVLVLTETSDCAGSEMLAERLRSAGWEVHFPAARDGERGVLVASRVALTGAPAPIVSYLPHRAATISIGALEIIGVYAPSRDESAEKIARKRRFLAELLTVIGARPGDETILIGDLNIVERGQRSVGGTFRDWEYELYEELPGLGWVDAYRTLHPDRTEHSWVDFDGTGFRFDHCFISGVLAERLLRCDYLHGTREIELSDHSAMTLEIRAANLKPLDVSPSLDGAPPSLF